MAGDLIPPPSPARRTDPEADPKATAELEEAVQLAAEAAAGTTTQDPSPFRSRFGFLFGVLAGLAICSAAALALLLTSQEQGGPALAENWSEWKPSTSRMLDGALEIAEHVGVEYKGESGDQLVQVVASGLELDGEEVGVAIRPQGGTLELLQGEGVLYFLNGFGDDYTVTPGEPTRERGRLLMRQALELALYSFRYLDDVTMVGAMLPPVPEAASGTESGKLAPRRMIFYRPGDLLEQLEVPLAETLSPKTPRPDTMATAEAQAVDSLTLSNLFLASLSALEADRNYLVLQEPDTIE